MALNVRKITFKVPSRSRFISIEIIYIHIEKIYIRNKLWLREVLFQFLFSLSISIFYICVHVLCKK